MEEQEIFDKVASHLLTQKVRSTKMLKYDEGGWSDKLTPTCMYRGENGTSCAIGCLIPDEMYSRLFECQGVAGPDILPTIIKLGLRKHINFLSELQMLHDRTNPIGWKGVLKILAEGHGLSIEILNNYE